MGLAIFLAVSSALALILIWLGYPAAVCAVAAFRRPRMDTDFGGRTVSFILATRDDARIIESRVRNFLDTDLPQDDVEVIVAVDAAAGEPLPPIDEPRVRILHGDAPGGKAASLNAAVRAARHEVLVFSDSAQVFDRSTARLLVDRIALSANGAVSGQLVLAGGRRAQTLAEGYWILERALRRWEARIHSTVGVSGSVYAMRRELWKPLPEGLILDDLYVPMHLILAGWRVDFEARATATDVRSFATNQERGRKTRTLTGVLQLCAWMPAVLNPMRNPVWVQFLCHKLLRMLTPYLSLVCAASVIVLYSTFALAHRPVLFVTAAALLIMVAISPLRVRLWSAIHGVWAVQAAIVGATWNAARGRWDVWHR